MSEYVALVKAAVVARVPADHVGHWAALGWTPADKPAATAYDDLTIPALKAAATEAGADITGLTLKADIIAALTAHATAQAAAGAETVTPDGDTQ